MRPLKLLGLCRLLNSFTDDNEKVLSQNKWNPLPLITKLLLLVIQEVTEVDVEELEKEEELGESLDKKLLGFRSGGAAHLSVLLHHDVGVVSVSNSQDESGNAVTSTGPGEQVDGPVVPERQAESETDR